MNTARLQKIRKEERKYHEECFEHYKLYDKGSWLHKPVKLVMELVSRFDLEKPVRVLDLGCGVGRNSLPLARKVKAGDGRVVCVDLLDKALHKLKRYSQKYGVSKVIAAEQADIGDYRIPEAEYDYIVAASSLEHCKSEEVLKKVLRSIAEGTKSGGINCIIMNTNIKEIDAATGGRRETLIEVVMAKDKVLDILRANYKDWEELHVSDEPLDLDIERDEKPVILKADCLTFAVRKP
jgi:2-polyprenyl-3-methyl-5-hydroxy-6-metoxy-1,4-benzoquinol methylase